MVMLAFAWPTLTFLHALEWLVHSFFKENMEDKVVLITGASSAIGEVYTTLISDQMILPHVAWIKLYSHSYN